jgi:hypothetical protein
MIVSVLYLNTLACTVNDNILPLMTLIAFDAYLRPELLHAPRALLTGFHPPPDSEQVPHLEAILKAAFPTQFTMSSIEGMCFRRVAWGGGVKVMYQHLLGSVRRKAAELLRQVVLRAFHPPSPYKSRDTARRRLAAGTIARVLGSTGNSTSSGARGTETRARSHIRQRATAVHKQHNNTGAVASNATLKHMLGQAGDTLWAATWPVGKPSTASTLSTATGTAGKRRPLNVVIYTRGSSGVGRTIAGEDKLRDRLNQLGARALVCCDFGSITLAQQLGYAVHADVVLGLHGAGLVNSILAPTGVITVELKTYYGYGLTLFALAAEARQGTFVELDIRDYHIWGKPGQSRTHPVDDALIGRVVQALVTAVKAKESASHHNNTLLLNSTSFDIGTAFKSQLFVPLPRPTSPKGPALPNGKTLSGGDLMVLPYPTAAWEAQLAERGNRSSPQLQSLDFQLHMLGPTVQEAASQCDAMTLSAYWSYVGERGVKDKYCLTCTL